MPRKSQTGRCQRKAKRTGGCYSRGTPSTSCFGWSCWRHLQRCSCRLVHNPCVTASARWGSFVSERIHFQDVDRRWSFIIEDGHEMTIGWAPEADVVIAIV